MTLPGLKPHLLKRVRRIHKWLMWIVGLQFLFWTLGGLYFSLFDIHYIHGESLVNNPNKIPIPEVQYGFAEVLRDYPGARNIKLYALNNHPYLQFLVPDGQGDDDKQKPLKPRKQVVDAVSGNPLSQLDETRAKELALAAYSGSGAITESTLITEDPPFELWSGHLPVWQIRFADFGSPVLYISQTTGQVVTKRHVWWRIFDLFWRLHILDIFEGANVKNTWLTIAATMAMITALAGVILTWYLVLLPQIKYQHRKPKPQSDGKAKTRFFRRWHRRLSVPVAVQMALWITTGLYFNVADKQWYSATHYLAPQTRFECSQPAFSLARLNLSQAPIYIELKNNGLGCYLLVHYKRVFHQYQKMQAQSFDVKDGSELSQLSKSDVLSLAANSYKGPGDITTVSLLKGRASSDKKQQNPVWRVDFSDDANTSAFVHSVTRQIIRHENDHSRFHQLMFTLHFMDYFGTGGFSHWLLKLFAFMALMLTLTGIYWLLTGRHKPSQGKAIMSFKIR